MHDHDLDLIAAWVAEDPSLTEEERVRARSLVSSCDECRAEAELQRSALAALASLPPAYLTDDERRRLHDGVRAAAPAAPRPVRGRTWRRRLVPVLLPVAAAAVALVVLIGLTGGRGSDEALPDATRTMQADTESAAVPEVGVAPEESMTTFGAAGSAAEEGSSADVMEVAPEGIGPDDLLVALEEGSIVDLLERVAVGEATRCTAEAADEAAARGFPEPPVVAVLIETVGGPREAFLFESADASRRLLVLADDRCDVTVLP